jgi:hypothetical protein
MNVVTDNSFNGEQVAITWDAYTSRCTGGWPITGCTVAVLVGGQGVNPIFTDDLRLDSRLHDITASCAEARQNVVNNNVAQPTIYDANG